MLVWHYFTDTPAFLLTAEHEACADWPDYRLSASGESCLEWSQMAFKGQSLDQQLTSQLRLQMDRTLAQV